jgi:hypothetical protein
MTFAAISFFGAVMTAGIRSENSPFEPVEISVYIGRERLGQYVQTDRKQFKAFDANDRPLGSFAVITSALTAIRKARRKRA